MTQALHEPLEAPAVKETVEELYGRIEARFPKRGLLGVCGDLIKLVDEVQDLGRRRATAGSAWPATSPGW